MNKGALLIALSFFIFYGPGTGVARDSESFGKLRFESGIFDPTKPTIVFFGGGNCVNSWKPTEAWNSEDANGDKWFEYVNVVSYEYYLIDAEADRPTYFNAVQLFKDTLRSLAPAYDRPIQSCGFSTGGSPALDLAIMINESVDVPFKVENVTLMDSPCYDYNERIKRLNERDDEIVVVNLIGGLMKEDNEELLEDLIKESRLKKIYDEVINVDVCDEHDETYWWYVNALDVDSVSDKLVDEKSYLSIIGGGKSLTISAKPKTGHYFKWVVKNGTGRYEQFDAKEVPLRLED